MLSNPLEMNRFSIITTTSLQPVIYPPARHDLVVISSVFFPRLAVWLDVPVCSLTIIPARKCPVRLPVLLFRPENPSQNGFLAESPRYSKNSAKIRSPLIHCSTDGLLGSAVAQCPPPIHPAFANPWSTIASSLSIKLPAALPLTCPSPPSPYHPATHKSPSQMHPPLPPYSPSYCFP